MANKHKLLFLCIHNSARSQMAEAFLKKYGEDVFEVESAGLEPAPLNPNVVEVMGEVGIDLRQKAPRTSSPSSARGVYTTLSSPSATRPALSAVPSSPA
jgi:protein-tyrosine-phosphatase